MLQYARASHVVNKIPTMVSNWCSCADTEYILAEGKRHEEHKSIYVYIYIYTHVYVYIYMYIRHVRSVFADGHPTRYEEN